MTFGYHPETGIRRQLIPVTPAPALYEVPLHRAPSTLKSVSWYSCAAVSQASPTGLGTSWMLHKHSCVAWMVLEWRCKKKQTGATVKPGNRDMVVPRAGGGGGGGGVGPAPGQTESGRHAGRTCPGSGSRRVGRAAQLAHATVSEHFEFCSVTTTPITLMHALHHLTSS